MENNESVLRKYRRQPKIYIDLPSKGQFYNQGVVYENNVNNLPVYSMTPSDEILFKTPDALINGNATTNMIKSCIPSIMQPNLLKTIDVDVVLIASRMATYGSNMTVTSNCVHCKTENEYEIPLQYYLDYYNSLTFEDTITVDNFIIKIQPLTYQSFTELQKHTVALQRSLQVALEAIQEDTTKADMVEKVIEDIQRAANEKVKQMIVSIEVDNAVETDFNEINDFLENNDADLFDKIKKFVEKQNQNWKLPSQTVQCESCQKTNKINITLDQSDFFGRG